MQNCDVAKYYLGVKNNSCRYKTNYKIILTNPLISAGSGSSMFCNSRSSYNKKEVLIMKKIHKWLLPLGIWLGFLTLVFCTCNEHHECFRIKCSSLMIFTTGDCKVLGESVNVCTSSVNSCNWLYQCKLTCWCLSICSLLNLILWWYLFSSLSYCTKVSPIFFNSRSKASISLFIFVTNCRCILQIWTLFTVGIRLKNAKTLRN